MNRVVSASDLKHNKRVPPLQDNVELLVKYMIEWRPYLRSTVMFRWADIKQFLGVTIALGVSVLWDQVGKCKRAKETVCHFGSSKHTLFQLCCILKGKMKNS